MASMALGIGNLVAARSDLAFVNGQFRRDRCIQMGMSVAAELAVSLYSVAQPLICKLCGTHDHHLLFRKAGYDLVSCRSCGLAFVANPPSLADIEALYTDNSGYHAALTDPTHPTFARVHEVARQHMRFLHRSVPDCRGLKLLDIGCSNGLFLNEARKAGIEVYGAEISSLTAGFARDHFDLNVHCGDWRDAGHAEGSFDAITLFDVIEHLPDPLSELVALRRLLKPGGLLLQSTPNIDGLFPRMSFLLTPWVDYWPHPEPPHHLYQFSLRTLRRLTKKAGLSISRADQTRIPLDYSFGTPTVWKKSPKMLAYAILFAGSAIVGPWLGMGDWLYLASRNEGPGGTFAARNG